MRKRATLLVGAILAAVFPRAADAADQITAPPEYSADGQAHYRMRIREIAAIDAPKGAVAMVGDSITEGGDWRALLPGAETVNFGVSYDRTSGLLARLLQIEAAAPSKVVLLIGTNDIGNGVGAAEIAGNARAILMRMKSFTAADYILVQSVLPREAAFEDEVVDVNARLRAIAKEEGAAYLDLYPAFLVGDGLDPAVTEDGLHLNAAGYRRWAGLIREWISAP